MGIDAKEITAYWNERSTTYSNGVVDELADSRRVAWEHTLDSLTQSVFKRARKSERVPRVLDLGCGPGFFSVIFTSAGCEVDAVDASPAMLDRARENLVAERLADRVSLHCCDIGALPFSSNTFDVAISRNVTWLMRDPGSTYAEWLRVLAPGGKLLVFDANWYRYLVDPAVDAQRMADQQHQVPEDPDAQATPDEELRCERIAARLPLTSVLRPEWDVQALAKLGAIHVRADTAIWRELWTEEEALFYGSSPLFLVEATKV